MLKSWLDSLIFIATCWIEDAAFSRFGVMFFSDPVVAFANIRRSLKPSGRLVFVCWRPLNQNPWMRAPLEAALPVLPPIAPMQLFDPGERCAVQRLALKPIKDPVVEYPNWSVKRSEAKVKAEPKAVGAFREGGGWCHNYFCPLRTGRCGDADERSLVGVDLATLFGHTIDEEIDVLVVERDETRNFCAIRNRHCVRPSDVVALDLAFVQAPVARKSFVGAAGALVRGLEEVHAHVGLRHVIANRCAGFVDDGRSASIGELHAIERNLDVARTVQNVDALIRIVGVDEHFFLFLKPSVHLIPFET